MAADTDGDSADEILFDFGSNGLWLWNDGSRTQMTEDDPEYIIAADTDGDSADELVVDFGALGLWLWNDGVWTYLTNDNPEFMAAGDTDGDGADEVAVDFGGLGVYLWNGGDLELPDARQSGFPAGGGGCGRLQRRGDRRRLRRDRDSGSWDSGTWKRSDER